VIVDVVIVIPAYNEATTVAGVVAAARVHAPVLVVDDGSTDDTALRATEAGAVVIRHPARRGKGAALATAFAAARARGAASVMTLDADGQHDPADAPSLLAGARAIPRAIVIGSRCDDALPCGRALAIRLAGFWVNWITGAAVADTQSGFRVYPLALFDAAPPRGRRFVFETAILVAALRQGWSVREVPIRVVPYAARQSRFHPIADGVSITCYLVARSLARWATELGTGLRAVGGIVSRERRIARHARMLAHASPHAGTPTWGPAIGVAFTGELRRGLIGWWRHPRMRRARRAALATGAAPIVLLVVAVIVATRTSMPTRLVRVLRRIYDQDALPPLTHAVSPERQEDPRTWATVTR